MSVRRFENIDALRGLAALLVVWLHASELFVALPAIAAHGTAWYDVADLLGIGRMGVVAFFAISGYVIVPTVRGPRRAGTIDFVIKRCFRLFPPFWFAIAVASITVWWLFGKDLSAAIVIANLTMLPLEFKQPQVMGHFWTLEVELIFYLLVLLLFWTRRLQREAVIAGWLVGTAVAWAVLFRSAIGRSLVDHNLVWSYLSYFIAVMFWGAMVRTRRQRTAIPESPRFRWTRDWPFVVVTALVFGRPLLALLFGSPTVHREDWRGTLLGLLVFLGATRVPDRFARPFAWLGTISYSLYLLHPAVFYPIFHVVAHQTALATAPLWVYLVLSSAASIACAALAYRVVERPANAIARRWVARRHAGDATAAGQAGANAASPAPVGS